MEKQKNNILNKVLEFNSGRRAVLISFDVFCFSLTSAAYIITDFLVTKSSNLSLIAMIGFAVLQLTITMIARFLVGAYRFVWRYSSAGSYIFLTIADVIAGFICLVFSYLYGARGVIWQFVIIGAVDLIIVLSSRFVYSSVYKHSDSYRQSNDLEPVAVIGAGSIGSYLVEYLRNNPHSQYDPKFFIDNDPMKIGNTIEGLRIHNPIAGGNLIKSSGIKTVIVTIANDDSEYMLNLYNHYSEMGCKVRVYDSLVKSDDSSANAGKVRDFKIEDVLFRKPVKLSDEKTVNFYEGKTVLITGGGGSIGSELCRQVATCNTKKLVIFDIYENNAYDIQQELKYKYGDNLNLSVEIGSVRDLYRLDQVFNKYRPDVVFHAAAHKHVPLMEDCGAEAIKNNVVGTYNTADVAEKYGVKKFILISTDKAVNPTNIMGASKRVCEMIVQSRADSKTSFAAVRFGNVLGSNGSVVPLFKRQIEEGGPITITDKRIIRYFMTIPEASQLVLQAGAMAKSGELFVLDMGKPVKIYDLACSMIRLSGLVPDKDIKIEEIGLRPGEKLYEELLMANEDLSKTDNKLIFIERDKHFTRLEVFEKVDTLIRAANSGSNIREAMRQVVPTYHTPEEVNKHASESDEMKLVNNIA
ncbi:nucleoside-diphosphate sugar epimerase/dehydratase [Ruminococcus sp.]|uniref:polysaccharide biosynthesis protein n=1 Tax=Ruminococcus sp. TaxID=41978 RepID=UPI0025D4B654|nr:nucleoside-diphosphate sugar epimerase/dehydratase [Ruminococcus sp.]MBR1431529.1 polysaccharide biosynthesis protein [Ruminococcus sp.]